MIGNRSSLTTFTVLYTDLISRHAHVHPISAAFYNRDRLEHTWERLGSATSYLVFKIKGLHNLWSVSMRWYERQVPRMPSMFEGKE